MQLLRLAELVGALTLVLAFLGGAWRWLRLGELLRGIRDFLTDWQGEPGRPGRDPIPSVPTRLARVEDATESTSGQLSGVAFALDRLQRGVDSNAARVEQLDRRVSRLEVEVERRLDVTLLRAETYRAALVELGLDVDPPPFVVRQPDSERNEPA